MQDYKDLKVWDKWHSFTLQVYEQIKTFPKKELYSLTHQLRRAAFPVPVNIALGSSNEAEYFLILSKDLSCLSEDKFNQSYNFINEVKGMLIALINKAQA